MRVSGDPAFTRDRTTELLAPDRMKARRARIASERTHAAPRFDLIEPGTSHLVVVDAKGNVVSMTTTINDRLDRASSLRNRVSCSTTS